MVGLSYRAADVYSPEEYEDVALEAGPQISIRSLKAAAARRKPLWVLVALAGLIIGANLHLLLPSKVTAVSRIYLVELPGVDPTVAMTNELGLIQTRRVALAALNVLHEQHQPAFSYTATATGSSVMTVAASGATDGQAVARANAVSYAFLDVRAQIQEATTGVTVAGLRDQVRSLEKDRRLQGSGEVGQERVAADIGQISAVQAQISQEQQNQSTAISQSVVLDSAYPVSVSAKKTYVKDGLSGLVAGLALGLGFVILSELLSDRVRTRSDVATALGVPVELSVERLS